MGSVDRMNNIGGYISVQAGIVPTYATSETINGTGIDRLANANAKSCVLTAACGAAAGTPSAQTVNAKLQHSTASGSGYADVTNGAVTEIAADNGIESVDIDMSGLNRYIRAVVVVALTGGSTPKLPVDAKITLGGSDTLPLT